MRFYAGGGIIRRNIKDIRVDMIEVYDWDGDFIRKFQTSVPFDAMSVSEDDKVLYTLSVDLDSMEPVVIRYDLDNTDNVRHF